MCHPSDSLGPRWVQVCSRSYCVFRAVGGVVLAMALAACQSGAPTVVDSIEASEAELSVAASEYRQALDLLESGQIDKAVKELEAFSGTFPEFPGPFLNLGIAYLGKEQLPQAEQAFKMAIARMPDNAVAYNQLGIVFRKLGRFTESAEAYKHALEIDPSYALPHLNLGVLYDLYLQQPEQALQELESYLAITGDDDETVGGWIKEIKARLGSSDRAVRSGA